MTTAREWVVARARALAASLATVSHARTIVAVCTAVVLVAGVLGVALHDNGDTDVAADRSEPSDLTPDSTETTLFEDAPPTSLLPPVASVPVTGSPGSTTTTTTATSGTTSTTAPAATACSGSAAVVSGTGLWLVDKADGRVRQVTSEATTVYVWSPDGKKLAYLSGPEDDRRLAVLDLATGTSRTVYDDLPVRGGPAWTGDQNSLVFAARPAADHDRLYKVSAEGGTALALHDLDSLLGDLEVRPGGSIVFTDGGTLAVVDAAGDNERTLVQATADRSVQAIAVSPEGGRVAFADRQHLVVMTIEDARAVNVATTEPSGRVLAWSADGSRVAFVRAEAGREVAVAAQANGTGRRDVGSGGADFTIAPNGKEMGWVADRGTTPKATATSLSTGADRQLGTNMWQPTWEANGNDIAVYATVANQPRPALCFLRDGTARKLAQLSATSAPAGALAWSPSGATLAFAALG